MSIKFSRGSEWRKWDLHVHIVTALQKSYDLDEYHKTI